jgi:hypothetical protein
MPSRKIDVRAFVALLACGLPLVASGCGPKNVQAGAPVSSAPSSATIETPPPSTTAPDTTAMPPVAPQSPPPDIPTATTAPPPIITPATKPAPKPQKPAPEPATVAEDHARPPAPQISPELSESDKANYRRGTTEDIGVAESNLQQATGKRLNAQQSYLVDKIKSFLNQSHDASKDGDLARAKNLAQKARLLSVELVNSL